MDQYLVQLSLSNVLIHIFAGFAVFTDTVCYIDLLCFADLEGCVVCGYPLHTLSLLLPVVSALFMPCVAKYHSTFSCSMPCVLVNAPSSWSSFPGSVMTFWFHICEAPFVSVLNPHLWRYCCSSFFWVNIQLTPWLRLLHLDPILMCCNSV